MRRRHVLLIIIIVIAAYISAWHLSPASELNMLIVDKTVPDTGYREHRAIFWIAKQNRISGPDGVFMQKDRDYLGYHPESGEKEFISAEDLEGIKLLYLADSYGIYEYPEGLQVYEDLLPHEHQDIELIYGGFDSAEAEAVADFAAVEGNILIGEHNILGSPTYIDPQAAGLLEELFDVTYSGWLARYYADLDECAFWMKELYSRIYGREWDLKGPGMAFVREDKANLGWYTDLVIVDSSSLKGPWPVISAESPGHPLLRGAADAVPYLYWVEVLQVGSEAQVAAYYNLPLKEGAREALRTRGLPERFPAMVCYSPDGKAQRIYFAGDFADQLPALLPPSLTGSAALQRFFSYIPGFPVEYRFYFQWYEPVLHNIFQAGLTNDDSGEGKDEY